MFEGKSIVDAIETEVDGLFFWQESESTMPDHGLGMLDDGLAFEFTSQHNSIKLTVGSLQHEHLNPEDDFSATLLGCLPTSSGEWVDIFKVLLYALDRTEESTITAPRKSTTNTERSSTKI